MRRYYYVEMIKVRYGFSVAEGWGWTWANGISDERFWSHTSLTWQSVFRADFSQSPETLHTVSRTGKQENTPHTGGGGTNPCNRAFFSICCLCYMLSDSIFPKKRMQQFVPSQRQGECVGVGDREPFKSSSAWFMRIKTDVTPSCLTGIVVWLSTIYDKWIQKTVWKLNFKEWRWKWCDGMSHLLNHSVKK